jgi:hypothetical protein
MKKILAVLLLLTTIVTAQTEKKVWDYCLPTKEMMLENYLIKSLNPKLLVI